jgi:hypothetical protein
VFALTIGMNSAQALMFARGVDRSAPVRRSEEQPRQRENETKRADRDADDDKYVGERDLGLLHRWFPPRPAARSMTR